MIRVSSTVVARKVFLEKNVDSAKKVTFKSSIKLIILFILGFFSVFAGCPPCKCNSIGALNQSCDSSTGQCHVSFNFDSNK